MNIFDNDVIKQWVAYETEKLILLELSCLEMTNLVFSGLAHQEHFCGEMFLWRGSIHLEFCINFNKQWHSSIFLNPGGMKKKFIKSAQIFFCFCPTIDSDVAE